MDVRKSIFLSFQRINGFCRQIFKSKPIFLRPLPLWEPAKWNKVQSCRFSLWQRIRFIRQSKLYISRILLDVISMEQIDWLHLPNALWLPASHKTRLIGSLRRLCLWCNNPNSFDDWWLIVDYFHRRIIFPEKNAYLCKVYTIPKAPMA